MPIHEPQTVPGSDALMALLKVIQDPKAHEAKLKEYADLVQKINASIETAGKAEAIPGLHATAAADRAKAAQVVQDAKAEAARITASAIAERDAAKLEAANERAAAAAAKLDREALDGAWHQRQVEREAEMARQEQNAATALLEARQAREDAVALKEAWEAKVAKLREAGVA